jgi:hypothetical protein
MPTSATEKHRRTQLDELQRKYDTLTKRIAAVDTDIGRELDSERKLILQERHADLVAEREQNAAEMKRIEDEVVSPDASVADAVVGRASRVRDDATLRPSATTVPSTEPSSSDLASLTWLQGRIDMQLHEGRISASDRETLHAIYRRVLSRIENSRELRDTESLFAMYDIDEGEAMAAQNTSTVNLVESLFTRTSHSLARSLAEVVQYHTEWPELIVGDEVTDKTIQALKSMQGRMKAADKLAAEYIAPSAQRRFQMERDGMVNSAGELVSVLDELSGHLGEGRMPWSIIQQMEHLLDDLTYYTNRCLLWLSDLAQSARPTEALQ